MKFAGHPENFLTQLKHSLAKPLPGEPAQNRMTSRSRTSTADYLRQNPNHRVSAVLMPLFPHDGEIYTAIIRRPVYPGMHSGQLALPGGKVEDSDASLEETALRETHEEVGIRLMPDQIIGRLSPVYIPPSNFLVHPFLAWLDEKPNWLADENEVSEILELPLSLLFNPVAKDRRRIPVGKNIVVDAPCYIFNGEVLWGATAMMFSELEAMLVK